ncbi:hypothetical protein MKW94_010718 [Papaver nudicaule]|uniref:Uncharacterized protein n=1 Tax=Papaver nudicaule TaxID=74823 RepID=A0AA41VY09_PAPNU|nr:hypothetical protein [Papaver nudicaule]
MAANQSLPAENVENDSGRPVRRWIQKHNLPRINYSSIDEIRSRFKIPASVEISAHVSLFDPVGDDEIVASLYQLECGLTIPIDKNICEILSGWKIALSQVHPSIFLAIKRLFVVARVYCRHLLPCDILRIIAPYGRKYSDGSRKYFSCRWVSDQHRLDGFPGKYVWEAPCFNWRDGHHLDIPRELATEVLVPSKKLSHLQCDLDSQARVLKLFDLPQELFDVSYPDIFVEWSFKRDFNDGRISSAIRAPPIRQISPSHVHGLIPPPNSEKCRHSSSSSPILPGRRKRRRVSSNRSPSPDLHSEKNFRRLRKGLREHQPLHMNSSASPNNANMTSVPDAMSEFVCNPVRRSNRLINKDYNYREQSLCASSIGFSPDFDGNRESLDSDSDNGSSRLVAESSEDLSSSRPPSAFADLNVPQKSLVGEVVGGNDQPSIVFITVNSTDEENTPIAQGNNMTPAHDNNPPPGGEKTIYSNEKINIQSSSSESLSSHHVVPDLVRMGANSTNPQPGDENARVCRSRSIPQPNVVTGDENLASQSPTKTVNDCDSLFIEHYNQIINSMAELNVAYNRRSRIGGTDVGEKQEIIQLKRENAELRKEVIKLTQEVLTVRQELDDLYNREQ